MLISLSACSNSDDGYGAAYDEVVNHIVELNEATDYIKEYKISAWNKLGDEATANIFLGVASTAYSDVSKLDYYTHLVYIDLVFGTSLKSENNTSKRQKEYEEKVLPSFREYGDYGTTAKENVELIPLLIEKLKEKYGDKHEEALKALEDYYLLSIEYREYWDHDSVDSFTKGVNEYKEKLSDSKVAAIAAK